MLRLRAIMASGAATAALVLSAGAAQANGSTVADSPASGGQYQQQMVHALAGSLGISDAAAVRRLDSQGRQQSALRALHSPGVDARGAYFDGKGRLTVNGGRHNSQAGPEEIRPLGLDASHSVHILPAKCHAGIHGIAWKRHEDTGPGDGPQQHPAD